MRAKYLPTHIILWPFHRREGLVFYHFQGRDWGSEKFGHLSTYIPSEWRVRPCWQAHPMKVCTLQRWCFHPSMSLLRPQALPWGMLPLFSSPCCCWSRGVQILLPVHDQTWGGTAQLTGMYDLTLQLCNVIFASYSAHCTIHSHYYLSAAQPHSYLQGTPTWRQSKVTCTSPLLYFQGAGVNKWLLFPCSYLFSVNVILNSGCLL